MQIVEDYHDRWNGFGRNGSNAIPARMGYLLEAHENPFGKIPGDVLK